MEQPEQEVVVHPAGEQPPVDMWSATADTFAGRVHVEWDATAPIRPFGQLPFFIDYLKQAGLFDAWVADCPLHLSSPNALSNRDVLGTLLLSVLADHRRYAHITSLRCDPVNPALLGMERVMSEDSVRRCLAKIEAAKGLAWLQGHLDFCVGPLLGGLGMAAMADAFLEMQGHANAPKLSREDWLGLLHEREVTARDNQRLGRRLRQARLRQNAVVEDTDFRTPRGLDRALFHKLAACDWIRHSQHLVISGPTGVGKSWLACALGQKACREGFSVVYRRALGLFGELAAARGGGRLPRVLTALERTRLLIIDDWGPEPLTAEQRRDLLEIVEDRYEKGSLLITSQVPVARWHELVGDPTIGDAILDRVVHRAHRIELKGPSLRKRQSVAAGAEATAAAG